MGHKARQELEKYSLQHTDETHKKEMLRRAEKSEIRGRKIHREEYTGKDGYVF